MNIQTQGHFPWKPIGEKAYLVVPTENILRPEITITTRSVHVKISVTGVKHLVRLIIYEKPGQRIVDDEKEWTPAEIRLAFNCLGGEIAESNPSFSQNYHAEFGLEKKFVRNGNQLILFCEDWKFKTFFVCIELSEEMVMEITRFLRYYEKK